VSDCGEAVKSEIQVTFDCPGSSSEKVMTPSAKCDLEKLDSMALSFVSGE
jgi:hypothetical protein